MYLPEPRGPSRMSECGRRPAAMAARRLSTVGWLPMKSWKVEGSGTYLAYLLAREGYFVFPPELFCRATARVRGASSWGAWGGG